LGGIRKHVGNWEVQDPNLSADVNQVQRKRTASPRPAIANPRLVGRILQHRDVKGVLLPIFS